MADEVEPEQHDRGQQDPQRPPPGEGDEQDREDPHEPLRGEQEPGGPEPIDEAVGRGHAPRDLEVAEPHHAAQRSDPRDVRGPGLELPLARARPDRRWDAAGEPSTRMSAVRASPVKDPIEVRAGRCSELPRASGTTASLRRAQERSMTSGPEYAVAGRLRWIESVPVDEAGIVSGRLLPVTAKPGIDVLALSMVQLAVVL